MGNAAITAVNNQPNGQQKARVASAATTNSTLIRTGAGNLNGWFLNTNTVGSKFLKFYDKATAPIVGTDTPVFTVIIEPAPNGATYPTFEPGIPFLLGLGYAITGAVTDADTTSVALNDVHGVILYS